MPLSFYGGRVIRGLALVGIVGLSLSTLVACSVASRPLESESPTGSYAPKYESKEQAVAAARVVYEHYLATADSVAASGGQSVNDLAPYVTSTEFVQEQVSASDLKKRNLRIVGVSNLVKFIYQSADLDVGAVNAYACVDFSKARVLDTTGADVTPATRPDRQTSVAKFVWQAGRLRLREISPWSGKSIC